MDGSRLQRLARGASAAGVATFVALLSHISAGAPMPGALGVIAPLMLSIPVCVFLAGRRLSALRVSLAVVISQFLFHTLFILGAGGGTATAPAGAHAHHGPVLVTGSTESLHAGHVGPGMWAAHALAASLTVIAIYRGEAALRALLTLAALAVIRFIGVLGLALPAPAGIPASAAASAERVLLPLGISRRTEPRRGPPAPAAL
ncbi:hypothetical protein [Mycetocola spongiae]|uniref:hypothetical protein n=1 Tax=Mycetocola spongiae TaxID=2859226 RepID=UPI001CF55ACF|nr:hypothetical protein [Mycetocola spongiae]UCR87948.1 hypothetical protein KXZ72_07950 [Mycetocola spongiae]